MLAALQGGLDGRTDGRNVAGIFARRLAQCLAKEGSDHSSIAINSEADPGTRAPYLNATA